MLLPFWLPVIFYPDFSFSYIFQCFYWLPPVRKWLSPEQKQTVNRKDVHMPLHIIVVLAIIVFIFYKVLSSNRNNEAKCTSSEPVYRKTHNRHSLTPSISTSNSDVTKLSSPNIKPSFTPSSEYRNDWAYPHEILPVNTIHRRGSAEAFEAEMNARYNVAKQKHQAAVSSIRYPVISQTDPSIAYILSPVERLFLWYINKKSVSSPKIGIYWRLDYGIYDFQSCIVKLMKAGLLSISDDSRDYLSRLTVNDLKALGSTYNVSVSGNKQKIIDTLIQEAPPDEFSRLAEKHATFKITESGEKLIQDNYGIIFYHRNKTLYSSSLTISDVDSILKRNPGIHPQDSLSEYATMPAYRMKKFLKEPRLL